jgi:mono/diheme cytochrome c family protein
MKSLAWYRGRLLGRSALFLLILSSALVGVIYTHAAPAAQSAAEGEALFAQRCTSCHTIGGGTLVGPDLKGVVALRERDWLLRWIATPDKLLADGDPLAVQLLQDYNNVPMPNMALSEAEVQSILVYLETADGTVASEPAAVPVPAPGDPVLGQALFTGQRQLRNGGTACISCHNVSQAGVLGGGALGPDLSHVVERYGEAGLVAALTGLPFPTMQGVFAERALTENEVQHLSAYFVQADKTAPAQETYTYTFVWIALGAALAFLGISHLIWRNRQRGVRKPLVRRMKLS